jgi:prepilin-type N-terminal cleavage/methylation domain-containing protein/prepilin-type processing-associated H-X9-DG protein
MAYVRKVRGFTLVELLVVVTIIVVLIAVLLPALAGAREQAIRVRCATNVRGIVSSMITYAGNEPDQAFPRTYFDSTKNKLQLDNAGYMVANTFGNSGYVGEDNVPASLFLLYRTQKLPAQMLICPATGAKPGFVTVSVEASSNWERYTDNVTYSMATPFPLTPSAGSPLDWRNGMPPEFALVADINPGTRGGGNPANNVSGPGHDAGFPQIAAANSNNHRNRGQNVGYVDGHVVFSSTPFCGARHPLTGIPDNIYTAGTGDGGLCSQTALPVDAQDSVMFPTDDPGGN